MRTPYPTGHIRLKVNSLRDAVLLVIYQPQVAAHRSRGLVRTVLCWSRGVGCSPDQWKTLLERLDIRRSR